MKKTLNDLQYRALSFSERVLQFDTIVARVGVHWLLQLEHHLVIQNFNVIELHWLPVLEELGCGFGLAPLVGNPQFQRFASLARDVFKHLWQLRRFCKVGKIFQNYRKVFRKRFKGKLVSFSSQI